MKVILRGRGKRCWLVAFVSFRFYSYTWKLYSVSFFIKNFFICSYCACSSFAVVYLQKQPTSSVLWKICFENFAKFTEKHLPRCLIFNKVGGLARDFKKKKKFRLWCLTANFLKLLEISDLWKNCEQLLLKLHSVFALFKNSFRCTYCVLEVLEMVA